MKPTIIKSKLIEIRKRKDRNFGTEFVLKDLKTEETTIIQVDENIDGIKSLFKKQIDGTDTREGIYLSKGMRNINIFLKRDEFDMNQEDFNWYLFSKEDVIKLVQ
ncbi:hypothetical protein [Alkaliphilus sp. B6464]|uniref:hypothetical protein n=1 Tax=Alkaliphilus sp. B6464 TaxID=2731219 RepID=UPI001BA72380|nr:hypothetical protein [Alkaliphilus sp. B6464]QUH22074.1 hypothetical protein HYG84_19400 [Alkaliphilus sp. B6464]